MTRPTRRTARRLLRLAPDRLPLRGRLTLVTTTVFAVLGCGVLVLNWLSSRQLIRANRDSLLDSIRDTGDLPPAMLQPGTGEPSGTGQPNITEAQMATEPSAGFADFQHTILNDLLLRSAALLVVFTLLAAVLAWWASRRSLRRLGQVTATARRISTGRSLDERLSLDGPHDEIRELGDTFDAMLDRLEHSFTAQRLFSAHASHELRTPLTVQRTALEIPLTKGRVPPELRPAVERALEANIRTERLIDALLTLARGESAALAFRPADLADAAWAAAGDLAEESRAAGVDVTLDLDEAPVEGDPALLRQVALNLIVNAVRHNHRGGTATVTTGTEDGRAYLEVANTGPVVAAEDTASLFTAFRRGRARADGFGLGLAVVEAVTTTHGGTATATARPEGGLVVRVTLPARA